MAFLFRYFSLLHVVFFFLSFFLFLSFSLSLSLTLQHNVLLLSLHTLLWRASSLVISCLLSASADTPAYPRCSIFSSSLTLHLSCSKLRIVFLEKLLTGNSEIILLKTVNDAVKLFEQVVAHILHTLTQKEMKILYTQAPLIIIKQPLQLHKSPFRLTNLPFYTQNIIFCVFFFSLSLSNSTHGSTDSTQKRLLLAITHSTHCRMVVILKINDDFLLFISHTHTTHANNGIWKNIIEKKKTLIRFYKRNITHDCSIYSWSTQAQHRQSISTEDNTTTDIHTCTDMVLD